MPKETSGLAQATVSAPAERRRFGVIPQPEIIQARDQFAYAVYGFALDRVMMTMSRPAASSWIRVC